MLASTSHTHPLLYSNSQASMSVNFLRALRKRNNRTGDGKNNRKSHDKMATGVIMDPPKQRKGSSLSAPPEVPILSSPTHHQVNIYMYLYIVMNLVHDMLCMWLKLYTRACVSVAV